jgi:hypothetical protein
VTTTLLPEHRASIIADLAGIDRAFDALIALLDGAESQTDLSARHQLEWARMHLEAAILGLDGRDADLSVLELGDGRRIETWTGSGTLRGHTQSIQIPELLGFIAGLRKSGTLVIQGDRESFLIELHDGAVVYAEGDNPPPDLLLGAILVSQGALTRDALEAFLAGRGAGDNILGADLLERNLITAEALRIALVFQIQHLFHRMCSETDAHYQFEENVRRITSDDVRLNVQMLLLETARHHDERCGK